MNDYNFILLVVILLLLMGVEGMLEWFLNMLFIAITLAFTIWAVTHFMTWVS